VTKKAADDALTAAGVVGATLPSMGSSASDSSTLTVETELAGAALAGAALADDAPRDAPGLCSLSRAVSAVAVEEWSGTAFKEICDLEHLTQVIFDIDLTERIFIIKQ